MQPNTELGPPLTNVAVPVLLLELRKLTEAVVPADSLPRPVPQKTKLCSETKVAVRRFRINIPVQKNQGGKEDRILRRNAL
jgi:hypothetical protein